MFRMQENRRLVFRFRGGRQDGSSANKGVALGLYANAMAAICEAPAGGPRRSRLFSVGGSCHLLSRVFLGGERANGVGSTTLRIFFSWPAGWTHISVAVRKDRLSSQQKNPHKPTKIKIKIKIKTDSDAVCTRFRVWTRWSWVNSDDAPRICRWPASDGLVGI